MTLTSRYSQVPSIRLGITQQNIDTTLTYVFSKFMDALRVMAEEDSANTFKSRLKKNSDEIMKLTIAIRKHAREAIK